MAFLLLWANSRGGTEDEVYFLSAGLCERCNVEVDQKEIYNAMMRAILQMRKDHLDVHF